MLNEEANTNVEYVETVAQEEVGDRSLLHDTSTCGGEEADEKADEDERKNRVVVDSNDAPNELPTTIEGETDVMDTDKKHVNGAENVETVVAKSAIAVTGSIDISKADIVNETAEEIGYDASAEVRSLSSLIDEYTNLITPI